MTELAAIGAMALLFIVFGLSSRQARCPTDGGCAGCASSCHRRPPTAEPLP